RLSDDLYFDIHNQSTILKMYSDEFLHLSEMFRAKLVRHFDEIEWMDTYGAFIRRTNRFEVDEDLDTSSLLAALAAYAEQQRRFLESIPSGNIVARGVVDRALMLSASLKSWSLIAEGHRVAS